MSPTRIRRWPQRECPLSLIALTSSERIAISRAFPFGAESCPRPATNGVDRGPRYRGPRSTPLVAGRRQLSAPNGKARDIAIRSDDVKAIKDKGHSLCGQRRIRVGDMEMQVRPCRVAREPQFGNHVA